MRGMDPDVPEEGGGGGEMRNICCSDTDHTSNIFTIIEASWHASDNNTNTHDR